jgi:ABC-type antimicrobial peptide transport system permease subunit
MDARARFVQPIAIGDSVTIDNANGQPVKLRVVGLAHADEYSQSDTVGYMNSDGWQQLAQLSSMPTNTPNQVSGTTLPPSLQLLIKTRTQNVVSAEQSHRQILRTLNLAHITTFASGWSNPGGRDSIQLGITGLLIVVRVLAAIALALVCLMILNTMTTLLSEQMKIIGTMKAIGGTRWRIISNYLLSIGIYAVIGTALGIGLGLWFSSQITNVIATIGKIDLPPYQVSLGVLLISALVGLVTPLVAALFPLWLGTRITVRDAISSYGVSSSLTVRETNSGGHSFSWLPQTVSLGLRGIFRKPWLALLTLLALMLSATVFMAIQVTSASISATLQHGSDLNHSDLSVYLSDNPLAGSQIIPVVQALPNVARVESINSVRATLKGRIVELVGLKANTNFYQPQLVAGRWLTPTDQHTLVVSDMVAQRLGLHSGQRITLAMGTQSVDMLIVGIVHETYHAAALGDNSSEVGMTFTPLSFLNIDLRHTVADGTTNIEIQSKDTSSQAILRLKDQVQHILDKDKLHQAYFSYVNSGNARQSITQVVIIYALFDTIATVVALVSLLSLSNMLAAAVLERRREIGILRSLGATGWRVGMVFWIEGLALALLAWFVGTLLGFPGGYAIVNVLDYFLLPLDLTISPIAIIATLIFIIVVSFVASFGPSLSASHVRIQETLRYE